MKHYKMLFCDLDGTLIKTRSGETFPEGVWDMELRLEVFEAIKKLDPDYIGIVTNQGGISEGFADSTHFYSKLNYVCVSLGEYLGTQAYGKISARVCESVNKKNYTRKPNVGMLEDILKFFNNKSSRNITKSKMLMIGDSSWREVKSELGTDAKTAQNFGIDYMDVEDFVRTYGGKKKNAGSHDSGRNLLMYDDKVFDPF